MWCTLSIVFQRILSEFQLYSACISLSLGLYSCFSLYISAHKKSSLYGLNVFAWVALFSVVVLELVFLIGMLVKGNEYKLVKTNYGTLRVDYIHSLKQILMLFGMGLVGILTLLICAVSS